jgi:hypothetical protein
MALIDDVKTALRITTTEFDSEIINLINTAKADLNIAGLYKVDASEEAFIQGEYPTEVDIPLIKQAIILYCKANFGYDNPEADRFQESYEMLKNHLSMSSDYAYYKVTIEAGEQCQVIFDGQVKETDNSGQVVFYSRAKNHVPYIIGDADIEYIDITNDTTITAGG